MNDAVKLPSSEALAEAARYVASIAARGSRHETPCGQGTMVWRRWGSGPPVVLMHGGGGAWSHWIRNIVPLSECFSVWAIDIPGLGESAAPKPLSVESIANVVEAGLRSLIPGHQTVSLVGFSFGTSIATVVGARLGDRLAHLVLTAARFVLEPHRVRPQLVAWRKIADPAARLAAQRRNLEILMMADPDKIDALAVYLQSTNTPHARFAGPNLRPGPGEKMHEYLPRVRPHGRVTGISGSKDRAATAIMDQQQSALKAIVPSGRFYTVEGAGHWVQYEAATRFNELLVAALSEECS